MFNLIKWTVALITMPIWLPIAIVVGLFSAGVIVAIVTGSLATTLILFAYIAQVIRGA